MKIEEVLKINSAKTIKLYSPLDRKDKMEIENQLAVELKIPISNVAISEYLP